MARTYKRDSRGRFAGGGGSSSRGGGRKPMQRGTNRLTRDNAGRITSVGGDGATARGGRLRTASGKQRATVTASPGAAEKLSSAPIGTIGKTRKEREIQRLDRPGAKRPAFNEAYKAQRAESQQRKAAPADAKNSVSAKGSRFGGTRQTMRAATPSNTVANRTGQRKTLNKFNSRPVGTMVPGKGINLVPSPTRVPLRITTSERDVAFARTATKAARSRAAMPAKLKQKESTAIRASRAAANQKRVTQAVMAKAGKRKTPNKKQRRSIMTAEAAKRFYSTNAIDTLRVNVKRPGFRQPRPVTRFARSR